MLPTPWPDTASLWLSLEISTHTMSSKIFSCAPVNIYSQMWVPHGAVVWTVTGLKLKCQHGFPLQTAQRRLLHISALWLLCLCPSVPVISSAHQCLEKQNEEITSLKKIPNPSLLCPLQCAKGWERFTVCEGFFYCKGLMTESST